MGGEALLNRGSALGSDDDDDDPEGCWNDSLAVLKPSARLLLEAPIEFG